MYALFKKEISNFLSSLIGIMVIVVFLLITGLFLWVFQSDFNLLTYGYANLKADKQTFGADDVLTISVDITNTGSVAGKEPVLLFASDLVATSTPDNRRLRAFDKVELQPGETKTVTFRLPATDLAFVDDCGRWVLEAGDFRLQAGSQTLTITCNETKHFETPNI